MKLRIIIGSLLLLSSLGLAACGGRPETSTSSLTETRPTGTFTEVEIQGVGNLILRQGDNTQLIISGDSGAVRAISVDTENNRLKIRPQADVEMKNIKQLDFQLVVKDLTLLDVGGTVVVDAKDLKQPSLALKLSGTGNVTLHGTGDMLDLSLNGAGNYKGDMYQVKNAKVMLNGVGNVDVNATSQLDASITGSGSVYYLGNPQLKQNIIGTGKIERKSTQ